ncbi:fatty acid desaturase [Hoeflea prorocentri]|uniref:Fatty acid desaturase n=1 Tax=Hoeflea prorocentri TaxID=1922333 RepID=A0A9X3UHJ2_9HYPH|nr:fatty acid desaturase [Hoeflea prorocentri]MCY6380797.1 fatty acid desaturase [Hoeflea prorocentri]MDA5398597.1 fatty acid desaturase [Hoeflea prorocentri]
MILKDKTEWRTAALIILCYLIWITLLFGVSAYSIIVAAVFLIPTITLHSSLQHECLHGHPTRFQWFNDSIMVLPVGLYIPYMRFKDLHLEHHLNARICDPYDDPESWYVSQSFWQRLPSPLKAIFQLNNTLTGRVLLGPVISLVRMAISDARAVLSGDRRVLIAWIIHLALIVPVLAAVTYWSALPLWTYAVCAYGGFSLLMVRTYLEHQAEESLRARSVIIEDKGPLSLLFLNNNLHAVHHAYPAVAWHHLPSLYRRNRTRFLDMNKGYRFNSYLEIVRRFAFRRKEKVVYPLESGSSR